MQLGIMKVEQVTLTSLKARASLVFLEHSTCSDESWFTRRLCRWNLESSTRSFRIQNAKWQLRTRNLSMPEFLE